MAIATAVSYPGCLGPPPILNPDYRSALESAPRMWSAMALPRALRAYAPRAHQLCCSSAARRVLSTGGAPGRSFPGVFGVYKGKAALQVKLLPPTWIQGQGGRSLEREVPGRRHTHDDRCARVGRTRGLIRHRRWRRRRGEFSWRRPQRLAPENTTGRTRSCELYPHAVQPTCTIPLLPSS